MSSDLLYSSMLAQAFDIFFLFLPLWAPIILGYIALKIWLSYICADFIVKEGSVLLEIKLPREILKSPLAMELVFTGLHQGANNTLIDGYIKGKTRPSFSLEIVSIEGQVKFFIWSRARFRRLIETQIYAQYPGVEIYEAEDYTKNVHHPGNLKPGATAPFWAAYFKLLKPDVYPIKTYVDYGLDKDPKEELKIDPMTSVLEYMGSMRKGEQAWIQIVVQAHRKEGFNDGRLFKKADWTDPGKKEIKKLIDSLKLDGGDVESTAKYRQPTKGESEIITALERSLSKLPFDVGVRAFYIAQPEAFNPIGIAGLIGSFRQYSSPTLNGFKQAKNTNFDYPWEDFRRKRRNGIEKTMLEAYKRRAFFQEPYKNPRGVTPFILNTEELATIFHFPGSVATTPTIPKSMSKKGEPPPNLPI